MKKIKRKKRKGQEEIVGFVIIMVIVAVAILVFLGISIRKGSVSKAGESAEIYMFLESVMEYTTDCELRFKGDFSSLGELFEACNSEKNCLDRESACSMLERSLSDIFSASWLVGKDSPIKAYNFRSVYVSNENSMEEEIISLNAGEKCTGNTRGSTYISPAFPGRIRSSFELCY